MENPDQSDTATLPKTQPVVEAPAAKAPLTLDFASIEDKTELSGWFEFREGFELNMRFIARSELQQLAKQATINRFNQKTHVREPYLDNEKFAPLFCQKAIIGWRGLTPRILATIVQVDMKKLPKDRMDDPIAYDPNQMAYLLKKCYELDMFMNRIVTDLANFQPDDHAEELGNS